MPGNANYTAFYVAEPFYERNLGANAARDFCYYRTLRMRKAADPSFPFNDAHDTTYNVRDSSDWESTLKPRLHQRLRNSKNIVLVLSRETRNSRALREELDYGINALGLPVIVAYPGYDSRSSLLADGGLRYSVKELWGKVPVFRDSMGRVPTIHVPFCKEEIGLALKDPDLSVTCVKFSDTEKRGSQAALHNASPRP